MVVSNWKTSFNPTKPLIFSCLDDVSPNIRVSFHLLKYLREFLPRKLRFTEESDGGSWNDGSLISSYILFNILLQEVLLYPTPADWTDELLVLRLSHMLKSLARWSYIDFYKGIREESFSLSGLNDRQKEGMRNLMDKQMTRMTGALDALTEDYSSSSLMDSDNTSTESETDQASNNQHDRSNESVSEL